MHYVIVFRGILDEAVSQDSWNLIGVIFAAIVLKM